MIPSPPEEAPELTLDLEPEGTSPPSLKNYWKIVRETFWKKYFGPPLEVTPEVTPDLAPEGTPSRTLETQKS